MKQRTRLVAIICMASFYIIKLDREFYSLELINYSSSVSAYNVFVFDYMFNVHQII